MYILMFDDISLTTEKWLINGAVVCIIALILLIYILKLKRETKRSEKKVAFAKAHGLYEPISLHPVIDPNSCIKSGACTKACPEHDVLGVSSGRGIVINASRCVGHGACVEACPVAAITLCIGTEKRGVDLPYLSDTFQTNVPGIYIAGELGGMGLIKNAVEQGRQVVDYIIKEERKSSEKELDILIVGAGPAGISASLAARKYQLKFRTLEQETLGGTVATFPRSKIVMTSTMDLPMYGKVKLYETSKAELLDLWNKVMTKNEITIDEETKVEKIETLNEGFVVTTSKGENIRSRHVLLAIGRRGTPRKLGVPGEMQEKVAYRLLEPEAISHKNIMVVGGGDSAIESALLLCLDNKVVLSYRGDAFKRIKPGNAERIKEAIDTGKVEVKFLTNVKEIKPESILLHDSKTDTQTEISNDLIYIFAGGELPTAFLEKVGISVSRKFGEAILKQK
ncbi:MAG: NAD(P)-binding domain-containing protein [Bacteroidales bacterium]|nr:NAD(P)-binding domain-containing protein [Bacteroidales bacterium]